MGNHTPRRSKIMSDTHAKLVAVIGRPIVVKVEYRRDDHGYIYRTDTYWSDGTRTSDYPGVKPNYEL
jgi:hypothetical protein